MQHYLGGTNIVHSDDAPMIASWIPKNRDITLPAAISGTGANTVFLKDDWLTQDGGSPWVAHEMAHIWDINTSPETPFYGGVGDQLNEAMGGNIINCPLSCRFCDKSGSQNKHPFQGRLPNYGNNSTADYLAESFRLSVYPDSTPNDPVPAEAQGWMESKIQNETIVLEFPPEYQWSISRIIKLTV
jgi:hypothetical protein